MKPGIRNLPRIRPFDSRGVTSTLNDEKLFVPSVWAMAWDADIMYFFFTTGGERKSWETENIERLEATKTAGSATKQIINYVFWLSAQGADWQGRKGQGQRPTFSLAQENQFNICWQGQQTLHSKLFLAVHFELVNKLMNRSFIARFEILEILSWLGIIHCHFTAKLMDRP